MHTTHLAKFSRRTTRVPESHKSRGLFFRFIPLGKYEMKKVYLEYLGAVGRSELDVNLDYVGKAPYKLDLIRLKHSSGIVNHQLVFIRVFMYIHR